MTMFDCEYDPEMYQSVNSIDMDELLYSATNDLEYMGRTRYKRSTHDPDYYHRRLFREDEKFSIIHETEKAILFEVKMGRFWVPKKLLREEKFGESIQYRVHKSFIRRNYLDDGD